MAPVRAEIKDGIVCVTIHVASGTVSAVLQPDRAKQFGEALVDGAEEVV
jgi:hypothetical protein